MKMTSSLRNPIFISSIITVIAVAVILAWPQYTHYKEQYARRECAEQIAQEKTDNKQAIANGEAQCQLKRNEY